MPLKTTYVNGEVVTASDLNAMNTQINGAVQASGGSLAGCTGLPVSGIGATGSASSSTYLRGDGQWASAGISTGKAIAMAMVFG